MSIAESIADKLSKALAPLVRDLQDVNIGILGTSTQILRITLGTMDVFGERSETLEPGMNIIENVIIKHPMGNQIQLFESSDEENNLKTDSLDLWEILPIEMRVPYTGSYGSKPADVKRGDIIVQVLKDENGNKIPIKMQVMRHFGGFMTKTMHFRKYELTLYRGELPSAIKDAVDKYIASVL